MSFSNYIMGSSQRRGMSRFNKYAVLYGLPVAHYVWRGFISRNARFTIPQSIVCDRTFARDNKEVYCLSEIEDVIKIRSEIWVNFQICDSPLLEQKESFVFRWRHRLRVVEISSRKIHELKKRKIGTASDTYVMDEEQRNHELRSIFRTPPCC